MWVNEMKKKVKNLVLFVALLLSINAHADNESFQLIIVKDVLTPKLKTEQAKNEYEKIICELYNKEIKERKLPACQNTKEGSQIIVKIKENSFMLKLDVSIDIINTEGENIYSNKRKAGIYILPLKKFLIEEIDAFSKQRKENAS